MHLLILLFIQYLTTNSFWTYVQLTLKTIGHSNLPNTALNSHIT
ncbi:11357_t:CDS:2 [Dentiscutata erythropus]|uniref:11357_t:CDS:1 n=1 Tax=Dentiscutata erythropus TaxID=1348616 RepID=A0A9N9BBL2_9GLOM|nr:11357_t:CDS:2 [Dentiscutata erythropus]